MMEQSKKEKINNSDKIKTKSQKEQVLQLFTKQNPLSLNGKSIYRQDYESILQHNWLRTEVISSLITIFQKRFAFQIDQLVEIQLKAQTFKENQMSLNDLKQKFRNYVKIIDPFIVTMILTTQEDFILQTLEALNIFDIQTKYILFPMNTQFWKGNHWFLSLIKNPRYSNPQIVKLQNPSQNQIQLLLLNSIPASKNNTSVYMGNQISQQILRLLKLFHPTQKLPQKVTIKRVQKVTHQSNSYDCGILTIAFIQQMLFNHVFQNQIQRFLKLKLWRNSQQNLESKLFCSQINQKSEFLILKSSVYLRKSYRQLLQKQILEQNSSLFQSQQ